MSKGFMYILLCNDNTYYVGSTKYLDVRICQHQMGQGGKFTRKRLPIKLYYFESFTRIDHAFYREHQIKKWSRKKKEALIKGKFQDLKVHAKKNFNKN